MYTIKIKEIHPGYWLFERGRGKSHWLCGFRDTVDVLDHQSRNDVPPGLEAGILYYALEVHKIERERNWFMRYFRDPRFKFVLQRVTPYEGRHRKDEDEDL